MDISKFLLQSYQGLYKSQGGTFGNSLKPEAKASRSEALKNNRKSSRHNLMMAKRKIDRSQLDCFDETKENIAMDKSASQNKPQKPTRIELMKKWKEERDKNKKKQAQGKAPMFKVYHSQGLPGLGEALSTIKGRTMSPLKVTMPKSFKFTAPKNIKPIPLLTGKVNNSAAKPLKGQSTLNVNNIQEKSMPKRAKTVAYNLMNGSTGENLNTKIMAHKTRGMKPQVSLAVTTRSHSLLEAKHVSNEKQNPKDKMKHVEKKRKAVGFMSKDNETENTPRATKQNNVRRTPHSKKTPNLIINKSEDNQGKYKNREKNISGTKAASSKLNSMKKKLPHLRTPKSDDQSKKCNETGNFRTPIKQQEANRGDDFPVYVSPFVTVTRGKDSARKEYHQRRSGGGADTSFGTPKLDTSTGPKAGAAYFRKLLQKEIDRLEGYCLLWETYKSSTNLPDGAEDIINVAIGQCRLLITKKFNQFRGLILQCEEESDKVTCDDLHGFWDMIYVQVNNIDDRFSNLDKLRDNNWEEILPEKEKKQKPVAKKGRPRKVTASSALQQAIKAAREAAKSSTENIKKDVITFDGGFFQVESPHKLSTLKSLPSSHRKSLLTEVLSNRASSHKSSGLVVMNATASAKKELNISDLLEKTPGRSILKKNKRRSSKRKSKSVLFMDDREEKENEKYSPESGKADLSFTSPELIENSTKKILTPRRSSRLTKNKLF